jgi:hypothetical protein
MKVYLLTEGERGSGRWQTACYFFRRSALKAARRRIEQGGQWREVNDHGTSASHFWVTSALWMSVAPLALLFRAWSFHGWIRQRCHWQNLNDKKDGTQGSLWRHGRAWFHRKWKPETEHRSNVCFSWNFEPRCWFGAKVSLFDGDSDRDVNFSLHLGLAHFYLGVENVIPKKYCYPRHSWAHCTGVVLYEDHLSVAVHHAGSDCWECRGWKGWYWSCFVNDAFWGRAKYSETPIYEGEAVLEMPEGSYPVKVRLVESVWKRPRKPWADRMRRANLDIERGVPTPGKGENSWDCGQDATYGLTCPASTVEEALASLRASVMRDRERYGGKDWKPEAVAA